MAVYLIFLQYIFMNIFTSIFFEEQRVVAMNEDIIYSKYEHLRRKKILKLWFSGLFVCLKACKKTIKKKKDGKFEIDNDLRAVNVLREKMR